MSGLDRKNVANELNSHKIAHGMLENDENVSNGHHFVRYHVIFAVNETPPTITCASVMSYETVRINLIIAALKIRQQMQ